MNFPFLRHFNKSFAFATAMTLVCVAALVAGASAQRITKVSKKSVSVFSPELLAPLNVGYRLEQCANGPRGMPKDPCDTNSEWVTGNVVASKAQYKEGDSLPYRLIITGLTPGSTGNMVEIGWDTTKQGNHAIDYITSYDRTESGVDVCAGGNTFTCGPGITTYDIPTDPDIATMSGGTVSQIPGKFTVYGGQITGDAGYTLSGSYAGDSSRMIKLTFTAGSTDTVVIAWGGHISTRKDWGFNKAATNISGSPFHTFLVTGGSRDVQMQLSAVLFPGLVRIIKEVTTNTTPPGTASTFQFAFTASTNFGMTSFNLVDGDDGVVNGGPDTKENDDITVFFNSGDPSTIITVTENDYRPDWTLADITCVDQSGGSQFPSTADSSGDTATRTATIKVQEAEFVTCTFKNTELRPSAAPASVSGRVVNAYGMGIKGVQVVVTDAFSGGSRYAVTNPFGYYTFDDLESGKFYFVTVSAKGYTFTANSKTFTLNDSLTDIDFVANP